MAHKRCPALRPVRAGFDPQREHCLVAWLASALGRPDEAPSALSVTKADGSAVAGSAAWNAEGTELTFTPTDPLASGDYDVKVSTAAQDQVGNALEEEKAWSFTADASAPTITAVSPADGATGAPAPRRP
ncbi:MAG TPA: Ig-like domain-containing protein [Thermoleophilaceae bacterium]|nr:Ig-like domain-containing protein [Thermoleophilaceae bacterium]